MSSKIQAEKPIASADNLQWEDIDGVSCAVTADARAAYRVYAREGIFYADTFPRLGPVWEDAAAGRTFTTRSAARNFCEAHARKKTRR